MTKEELSRILKENKNEVDRAMKDFEEHSKNFDKKIKKIFSIL